MRSIPTPSSAPREPRRLSLVGVAGAGLAALMASALPAAAQEPAADRGWNGPAVLALVERGRDARRELVTDGDLESYRALTEGHIYFFVDPEEGERTLIRVDQVAVQLRWQAPDIVQQHILGERSEIRLPVREFRYYLDRLTLVQYGFGDEIQVGSGMDVAGVPHPLAPLPAGGPDVAPYEYRLSDSLSLSLPGEPEPLRLYEIEVRPRETAEPGILGTLLLDSRSGNIVRMRFTFTPASYVDRRTDRISVELDYGLWEGRYWLPNRQRIEVRRELPELDLEVGTVIRAVLRTSEYELNVPLDEELRFLPQVTQAPAAAREAYSFPEGLFDGVERDGLSDMALEADPRELRARAAELLRNRPPSGLSPLRFHLPRFSSALRYNRAEGLFLGGGASFRPRGTLRLRAHGGYAIGGGFASASVDARRTGGPEREWVTRVRWNALEDLGLRAGSDPLLSSLGAAVRAEDYLDPFRVSDIEVGLRHFTSAGGAVGFTIGAARRRHLPLVEEQSPIDRSRAFRPVRPVPDEDLIRVRSSLTHPVEWPFGGRGRLQGRAEAVTGGFGRAGGVELEGEGRWGPASGARELEMTLQARSWPGSTWAGAHRLIGGRGTLPGFPYRSFGGRHLAVASAEASTDLGGPLVRLRGGIHGGWTAGLDTGLRDLWAVEETEGVRVGVTLGVGLGWDVLRVEGARGLSGGEWQLLLSIDPRWWDQL